MYNFWSLLRKHILHDSQGDQLSVSLCDNTQSLTSEHDGTRGWGWGWGRRVGLEGGAGGSHLDRFEFNPSWTQDFVDLFLPLSAPRQPYIVLQ